MKYPWLGYGCLLIGAVTLYYVVADVFKFKPWKLVRMAGLSVLFVVYFWIFPYPIQPWSQFEFLSDHMLDVEVPDQKLPPSASIEFEVNFDGPGLQAVIHGLPSGRSVGVSNATLLPDEFIAKNQVLVLKGMVSNHPECFDIISGKMTRVEAQSLNSYCHLYWDYLRGFAVERKLGKEFFSGEAKGVVFAKYLPK